MRTASTTRRSATRSRSQPEAPLAAPASSCCFGFLDPGAGESRTTTQVTPAASATTQTMKIATPMSPRTVSTCLG